MATQPPEPEEPPPLPGEPEEPPPPDPVYRRNRAEFTTASKSGSAALK
jgi:hypothetical protein